MHDDALVQLAEKERINRCELSEVKQRRAAMEALIISSHQLSEEQDNPFVPLYAAPRADLTCELQVLNVRELLLLEVQASNAEVRKHLAEERKEAAAERRQLAETEKLKLQNEMDLRRVQASSQGNISDSLCAVCRFIY
jgi:hypothetical protein